MALNLSIVKATFLEAPDFALLFVSNGSQARFLPESPINIIIKIHKILFECIDYCLSKKCSTIKGDFIRLHQSHTGVVVLDSPLLLDNSVKLLFFYKEVSIFKI